MRMLILLREMIRKELLHHLWVVISILVVWAIPLTVTHNNETTAAALLACLFTPFMVLALGARAFHAESKEKTLTFQLTRPIRREFLVLLKFATLMLVVLAAMTAGMVISRGTAWLVSPQPDSFTMAESVHKGALALVVAQSLAALSIGMFASLWVLSAVTKAQRMSIAVVIGFFAIVLVDVNDKHIPHMQFVLQCLTVATLLLGASLGLVRRTQVRA